MAIKEIEQTQVEEKFQEVKKKLAALKAAIKKQEQASLQKDSVAIPNPHEVTELYIEKNNTRKKKIVAFEADTVDKSVVAPEKYPTLDVTSKPHIVVEL